MNTEPRSTQDNDALLAKRKRALFISACICGGVLAASLMLCIAFDNRWGGAAGMYGVINTALYAQIYRSRRQRIRAAEAMLTLAKLLAAEDEAEDAAQQQDRILRQTQALITGRPTVTH